MVIKALKVRMNSDSKVILAKIMFWRMIRLVRATLQKKLKSKILVAEVVDQHVKVKNNNKEHR